MKILWPTLCLILLISLIGNFHQWRLNKSYQKDSDVYFSDVGEKIRKMRAWQDSVIAQIDSVHHKRKMDSTSFASIQDHARAEIMRLRKKIVPSTPNPFDVTGPWTYTFSDSIKWGWSGTRSELHDFVIGCLTKDTLLQVQDSLIVSLEGQVVTITDSFKEELSLSSEQLQGQKEISAVAIQEWEKDKAKLKKTERKLKRQKAFTRIVGGVAFALSLGLIATSQ